MKSVAVNILQAITFAGRKETCQPWQEYRKKWGGNIPRKGTKKFNEYQKDTKSVQRILEEILKDIIKGGK